MAGAISSRSPDFERDDFKAERAGRCLNFAHLQHGVGIADIGQDRQPAETGDNLAQKFKSLAGKIGGLDRQAGDVAARSRQSSRPGRCRPGPPPPRKRWG